MKTKLIKIFSIIALTAIFLGLLAGFQFDIYAVHIICESVGFIAIFGCLSLGITIIVSIDDKEGEKDVK